MAEPLHPIQPAPEAAISAAMSEGNKHGVKSTVAAKIVAAYLNAIEHPIDRRNYCPEHWYHPCTCDKQAPDKEDK